MNNKGEFSWTGFAIIEVFIIFAILIADGLNVGLTLTQKIIFLGAGTLVNYVVIYINQ